MINANENQAQHKKGLLIASGERVVKQMIQNFGREVITAPFGEDVTYSGDWLGEDIYVLFAAQEIFQTEAAGVVVDNLDKVALNYMIKSGLSLNAVKLPLSESTLNLLVQFHQFFPAVRYADILIDDLNSAISRCRSDMEEYYKGKATNSFDAFDMHWSGYKKLIEQIRQDIKLNLKEIFLPPDKFLSFS